MQVYEREAFRDSHNTIAIQGLDRMERYSCIKEPKIAEKAAKCAAYRRKNGIGCSSLARVRPGGGMWL
jgi:hypothetical protein